jgi:hypothetical protein
MPQSVIGKINQWEQSNLDIFPPSAIYNVLVGTNLNTSGFKFLVVGNSKMEGNLEITGTLSATIDNIKVEDKDDNVNYQMIFINSSGNQIPLFTNNQITYNPSTNKLTVGNLTSNISTSTGYLSSNLVGLIQNNQLQNDSITIGSTEFNLGDTNTVLTGLSSVTSTTFIGDIVGRVEIGDIGVGTPPNHNYTIILTYSATPLNALLADTSFTFNPYTETLVATNIDGDLTNSTGYLTSNLVGLIQNNQLQNDSITIGSTEFNLGATSTTLTGMTSISSTLFSGNLSGNISVLNGDLLTNNQPLIFTSTSPSTYEPMLYDTDLHYNPNTGILTSNKLTSNLINSTGYLSSNLVGLIQNNQLQNDSITIGSTSIDLGATSTTLAGLTKMGIGNNSPDSTLSVNKFFSGGSGINLDNAISVQSTGDLTTNQYAFGLYTGSNTNTGNSYLQSGILDYRVGNNRNTANYHLLLQPLSGNVGIGNTAPRCPLEISGYVSRGPPSGVWGYYMNTYEVTIVGSPYNTYNRNISVIAQEGITCPFFSTYSDVRIKKNIKNICEECNVLETINQLSPKIYNYIDYISKGNKPHLGLIAQEVEKNQPNLINDLDMSHYVPDIYCKGIFDELTSIIRFEKEHKKTERGKVKIILSNLEEKYYVFEVISTTEIKISSTETTLPQNGDVFVYGTEIFDFKTIDYQQIFILGIAGIQELSIENDELKSRIDILEENQKKIMEHLNIVL